MTPTREVVRQGACRFADLGESFGSNPGSPPLDGELHLPTTTPPLWQGFFGACVRAGAARPPAARPVRDCSFLRRALLQVFDSNMPSYGNYKGYRVWAPSATEAERLKAEFDIALLFRPVARDATWSDDPEAMQVNPSLAWKESAQHSVGRSPLLHITFSFLEQWLGSRPLNELDNRNCMGALARRIGLYGQLAEDGVVPVETPYITRSNPEGSTFKNMQFTTWPKKGHLVVAYSCPESCAGFMEACYEATPLFLKAVGECVLKTIIGKDFSYRGLVDVVVTHEEHTTANNMMAAAGCSNLRKPTHLHIASLTSAGGAIAKRTAARRLRDLLCTCNSADGTEIQHTGRCFANVVAGLGSLTHRANGEELTCALTCMQFGAAYEGGSFIASKDVMRMMSYGDKEKDLAQFKLNNVRFKTLDALLAEKRVIIPDNFKPTLGVLQALGAAAVAGKTTIERMLDVERSGNANVQDEADAIAGLAVVSKSLVSAASVKSVQMEVQTALEKADTASDVLKRGLLKVAMENKPLYEWHRYRLRTLAKKKAAWRVPYSGEVPLKEWQRHSWESETGVPSSLSTLTAQLSFDLFTLAFGHEALEKDFLDERGRASGLLASLPPGSGKTTFIARLLELCREVGLEKTVAVIEGNVQLTKENIRFMFDSIHPLRTMLIIVDEPEPRWFEVVQQKLLVLMSAGPFKFEKKFQHGVQLSSRRFTYIFSMYGAGALYLDRLQKAADEEGADADEDSDASDSVFDDGLAKPKLEGKAAVPKAVLAPSASVLQAVTDRLKVLRIQHISSLPDDGFEGWALDDTPLDATARFTDPRDVFVMAVLHKYTKFSEVEKAFQELETKKPSGLFLSMTTAKAAKLAYNERAGDDTEVEEGSDDSGEALSPIQAPLSGQAAAPPRGLVRVRDARTPQRVRGNVYDERVQLSSIACRIAWQMSFKFNDQVTALGQPWMYTMAPPKRAISPQDWKRLFMFCRGSEAMQLVGRDKRAELRAEIDKHPRGYVNPRMQETHVLPIFEKWLYNEKQEDGDGGNAYLKRMIDELVLAGEASVPQTNAARDTPAAQRQRVGEAAAPSSAVRNLSGRFAN